MSKEQKNLAARLCSVTDHDYDLKHTELLEIVRSVNQKSSTAIEELCSKEDPTSVILFRKCGIKMLLSD